MAVNEPTYREPGLNLPMVYLDDASRPYLLRMWGGNLWLFYWHASKQWVSLRPANQMDYWLAEGRALPKDQAALYGVTS